MNETSLRNLTRHSREHGEFAIGLDEYILITKMKYENNGWVEYAVAKAICVNDPLRNGYNYPVFKVEWDLEENGMVDITNPAYIEDTDDVYDAQEDELI